MKLFAVAAAAAFLVVSAGSACAQDSTGRERLRQACAQDFQQFCANIPAGGGARLKCLNAHNDKLSSGCQSALAEIKARRAQGAGAKPSAPDNRK